MNDYEHEELEILVNNTIEKSIFKVNINLFVHLIFLCGIVYLLVSQNDEIKELQKEIRYLKAKKIINHIN